MTRRSCVYPVALLSALTLSEPAFAQKAAFVEEVAGLGLNPFQVTTTISGTITGSTVSPVAQVPAGKRLVITYVSYAYFGTQGFGAVNCTSGGTSFGHVFPTLPTGSNTPGAIFLASVSLSMACDPGSQVTSTIEAQVQGGGYIFNLSGYLVPLP